MSMRGSGSLGISNHLRGTATNNIAPSFHGYSEARTVPGAGWPRLSFDKRRSSETSIHCLEPSPKIFLSGEQFQAIQGARPRCSVSEVRSSGQTKVQDRKSVVTG